MTEGETYETERAALEADLLCQKNIAILCAARLSIKKADSITFVCQVGDQMVEVSARILRAAQPFNIRSLQEWQRGEYE